MPDDILQLLDNASPIDVADPRYRQLLDDVQCNILAPHRKRRAHYFFIRFQAADSGELRAKYLIGLLARNGLERATLLSAVRGGTSLLPARFTEDFRMRSLADTSQGTISQLELLRDITVGSELKLRLRNGANGFATNFLLTRLGCRKLNVALPDAAFNAGQAARWQRLNDPEPSFDGEHASWDARYDDADAVLVVAYDPETGDTGLHQQRVITALREFLVAHTELLAEEQGHMLRRASDARPIEAFGFRDGISQPCFIAPQTPAPQPPSAWNDFAPLHTVLTPDPHGRTPHACGSYFVFRKLRQDVVGFHDQTQTIAATLNRPVAEILAETVGRAPNGQPLATTGGSATLNDFDFSDDQNATRCPSYAHIRKVNPRGDVKAIYDAARRRIARRGLAFGPELARDADGLPDLAAARSAEPVGMLFLCAQADIAEQFEHLQAYWANSQAARTLTSAPDAIVGRVPPGDSQRLAARHQNGTHTYLDYRSFVEMRGGAYLFAPSISFLKSLLDDLWA